MCNIVAKGPYVQMATVDERVVEKTDDQYTGIGFVNLPKIYKAVIYIAAWMLMNIAVSVHVK